MSYDSRRQRVVLFEGANSSDPSQWFGDTWDWDGVWWVQMHPATSPAGRQGQAMAYDSARGRIVLFGGADGFGDLLADTWEYVSPELCNGIRDDGDGPTPPDEIDHDGDGYVACSPWIGSDPHILSGGDCDDTNPNVHPGAPEVCNGIDDNCTGQIDEDAAGVDSDGDGIHNACDNCPTVANANQLDSDADGKGDFCDNCPTVANFGQGDFDLDGIGDTCETGVVLADADRSGRVDGFDLAIFGRAFGTTQGAAAYDARVDFNRDGKIDGEDLAILAIQWGKTVGAA
jgi:hypothetical protein